MGDGESNHEGGERSHDHSEWEVWGASYSTGKVNGAGRKGNAFRKDEVREASGRRRQVWKASHKFGSHFAGVARFLSGYRVGWCTGMDVIDVAW